MTNCFVNEKNTIKMLSNQDSYQDSEPDNHDSPDDQVREAF
jgi:hypothetical protein